MIEFLLNHKGLFAFSDPGGSKAVLALICQLQEKGFSQYKAISDRTHSFYSHFNVNVEILSNGELTHFITIADPEYIFTGTSCTSTIELNCLSIARQKKIPSYAFVDHWTSFKKRFMLDNEYIFPDKVLVIDKRAMELAKMEGIPKQLLSVFSNPYYSYLQNWKPPVSKEDFLIKTGIENFSGKIISYFPEPLSTVGGIAEYGLDEYVCLELLWQTLIHFEQHHPLLLIKPHPNQNKEKLCEKALTLSKRGNISLHVVDEDVNTLIYFSDIVSGIFSNALIEASFFHKPIYRILKGLTIADPLNSMNIGKCIYSETELSNEFRKHF